MPMNSPTWWPGHGRRRDDGKAPQTRAKAGPLSHRPHAVATLRACQSRGCRAREEQRPTLLGQARNSSQGSARTNACTLPSPGSQRLPHGSSFPFTQKGKGPGHCRVTRGSESAWAGPPGTGPASQALISCPVSPAKTQRPAAGGSLASPLVQMQPASLDIGSLA